MRVMSANEAAALIPDNATVSFVGSGGGVMVPELTIKAIEENFLKTGHPSNMTLVHASGIGDKKNKGVNRFAHKGMVKRVIGGHWGWSPRMQKMALSGEIEAYNLPQGVIVSLLREIAAKRPGLITKVGLETFVDPRLGGGALNNRSTEKLVEVLQLKGEEWLWYKSFPLDVTIIRGTVADQNGNVSLDMEAVEFEVLAQAQAAHNSGGLVICQVKYLTENKILDPMLVKIPGILVDVVVVDPEQSQSDEGEYNPAFRGQFPVPMEQMKPMILNHRKVVCRRAAMELKKNALVNLGFGMPDGVASVAAEEGVLNKITLSIEQGIIGGMPAQGDIFGVAYNPEAIINSPSIFDFYSGNGLDMAFLGLAQADIYGNVNVSKFGSVIAGCGGFVDITQSAKKLIFCGTFTAGGLKTLIGDGKIQILEEGKNQKFIPKVEQVTYSGSFGSKFKQEVLYITERAVFKLTSSGLTLIEIAPGIDLEKDILAHMGFKPIISENLKIMDACIFKDKRMECFSS